MSLIPTPEMQEASKLIDVLMNQPKPIHAKPSLYAYYFNILKEIAKEYGYNLVLHGSLARDLDLIAIPWQAELRPWEDMIKEFVEAMGGELLENIPVRDGNGTLIDLVDYKMAPHGRRGYVINLNRGGYDEKGEKYTPDPQYYIDISIIPAI